MVDHVIAAVPDAEVLLAHRAEHQAMHIVTTEGDAHPESMMQGGALIGDAIAITIGQLP